MAISADLGNRLEDVVNQLVSIGRYNSKSEVLREGVRLVKSAKSAWLHSTPRSPKASAMPTPGE